MLWFDIDVLSRVVSSSGVSEISSHHELPWSFHLACEDRRHFSASFATVSDGLCNKMLAILQALLAWLRLSLSGTSSLKAPTFPVDRMVAIPVLVLLICATASLLLVLRSRQRHQITEQSGPNTLWTKSHSGWKASDSQFSRKLASEHYLNKQPSEKSRRLGLKLAVTMLLAIPCVLLFCGHFGHVFASLNRYRAIERSPERTSDSTGLQEVFQVYQPVSFAPEGLTGCDLDVLLMDHVFGQSYGKPFVGTRRVM